MCGSFFSNKASYTMGTSEFFGKSGLAIFRSFVSIKNRHSEKMLVSRTYFMSRARSKRRMHFPAVAFGAAILLAFALHCPCAAINVSLSTGNLTYNDGQGHTMPYRLYLPPGYNSSTTDFPLIIFLHGAGESGADNGLPSTNGHIDNLFKAAQGGYGAQYKSLLLVPQTNMGWQDYPPNYLGQQLALDIIDQIASTYRVDTRRYYLTGLSMGGFGTFDAIQNHPDMFAAAAPLSGGGDPSKASIIKDVPIWAFHGSADGTVPVSDTDEMFDAIEAAGGNMEYTRVDGVGHGGWETFYDGSTYKNSTGQTFYQWMFAQSLPVPEPASILLVLGAAGLGLLFRVWRFKKR
jgi:predicted peptidase